MIFTRPCIPNVMSNDRRFHIIFTFSSCRTPFNILLIHHTTISGTHLATASARQSGHILLSREATWCEPRLTSSKIESPRGLLWLHHLGSLDGFAAPGILCIVLFSTYGVSLVRLSWARSDSWRCGLFFSPDTCEVKTGLTLDAELNS